MASSSPTPTTLFLLVLSFHLWVSPSTSLTPKALVVPVSKDSVTLQYVLRLQQRTPLVPLRLTVHLGGRYLWVPCDNSSSYVSSTLRLVRCRTALCAIATNSTDCGSCSLPPAPGCNTRGCVVFPENPIVRDSATGEARQDVVSVASTDGSNLGPTVTAKRFLFACGTTALLNSLPEGVQGMAGLGTSLGAPPSQFASAFGFPRKFAICLPSSAGADGVVFFGDGPYRFLPGKVVISDNLVYTPLLANPVSTAVTFVSHEPSYEYFIGVRSIRVNNKIVPVNATLLTIGSFGEWGTKISTTVPYTVMESSIYKAVAGAFARESGLKMVPPVAPFGHCFDGRGVGSTRAGPAVPTIDLVLQGQGAVWRILGANSMVGARPGVLCLGFVDGGTDPRTAVVIGGHQFEDNLLQFDLAGSRLGFSSSLLFRQTTCANFNFTSSA